MAKDLHLLIVEDNEDDALLAVRELSRGGYNVMFERVETAPAMAAALKARPWDLVIADYSLPQFSGEAALELLKSSGLDIPFIIVSGSIGEDLAVTVMKSGASDYMMKGSIKRLVPSVERELREAEVRGQRRQAEEALDESEARKAAMFDAALDSIITIDPTGKIVEFNPASERFFGYHRETIIGRPLKELVVLPELPGGSSETAAVRRRMESTATRRDGSRFPVELSLAAISAKAAPMFIAYIRDLTEQKRQEEMRERSRELEEQNRRIEEANRLKSEFLANMSHELRTPLNAVIGFAEILVDGKVGALNDDQREFLGDILTSGQHLLQLINDVLDLAKIEAGKMELELETFPLRKVIEEVCAIMRPTAQKRRITIAVEETSPMESVTLDQRKFKQVLYNLLSNAVKFSQDQNQVAIIFGWDGPERFRLAVKDSGIGIKPEDMPRIFHEFEQLDSGAARRFPGTGLGLALTKRIIELHRGSISVESVPNRGSTFTIVLPAIAVQPRKPSLLLDAREL
jgi:protein-histidine pros-kinase